MLEDDELDGNGKSEEAKPLNRKKLILFVLPIVIVIGLSAGLFFVFNSNYNNNSGSYSIVKKPSSDNKSPESVTVFYDLPEVNVMLKTPEGTSPQRLRARLTIELSSIEDVKTIEIITPKILDAVIAHVIELTPPEVAGSSGLYWLKEELLYRINLITNPIKVNDLNFRTFEVEVTENKK